MARLRSGNSRLSPPNASTSTGKFLCATCSRPTATSTRPSIGNPSRRRASRRSSGPKRAGSTPFGIHDRFNSGRPSLITWRFSSSDTAMTRSACRSAHRMTRRRARSRANTRMSSPRTVSASGIPNRRASSAAATPSGHAQCASVKSNLKVFLRRATALIQHAAMEAPSATFRTLGIMKTAGALLTNRGSVRALRSATAGSSDSVAIESAVPMPPVPRHVARRAAPTSSRVRRRTRRAGGSVRSERVS